MITRKSCVLRFNTSLDGTRTIRVPEPAYVTDVPVILDAAAMFLSADPFDATIGSLVSLAGAELVTVNSIKLI